MDEKMVESGRGRGLSVKGEMQKEEKGGSKVDPPIGFPWTNHYGPAKQKKGGNVRKKAKIPPPDARAPALRRLPPRRGGIVKRKGLR